MLEAEVEGGVTFEAIEDEGKRISVSYLALAHKFFKEECLQPLDLSFLEYSSQPLSFSYFINPEG